MIFHNYFVFELRISKLMIFEEVAYNRFIKVFLFVLVLPRRHKGAKFFYIVLSSRRRRDHTRNSTKIGDFVSHRFSRFGRFFLFKITVNHNLVISKKETRAIANWRCNHTRNSTKIEKSQQLRILNNGVPLRVGLSAISFIPLRYIKGYRLYPSRERL